jgi:hypothetical protein
MSRACVCGGSNENCRFCAGLGTIPNRLANALTIHTYRLESDQLNVGGKKAQQQQAATATRPKAVAPLVICRFCRDKVRADRIDRHVLKVHGKKVHSKKEKEKRAQEWFENSFIPGGLCNKK